VAYMNAIKIANGKANRRIRIQWKMSKDLHYEKLDGSSNE
jgi:hypothetical protein